MRKLSRASQDRVAELGAYTDEVIHEIRTVQAYGHEQASATDYNHRVEATFATGIQRVRQRALLIAAVITLVFSALAVILWVGGHDVLSGELSAGELSAFIFYAVLVASSMGTLSEVIGELQRAAGATRPVAVVESPEQQAGSRYIDWVIPGLLGLNLMSTGMWGIGFGIVTMRQKKQLKRLIATPMPRGDFLLSQMLARLAFLVLEVPPLMLFAWLAFGVVMVGPWLDLAVVVLLGTTAFAGLGLLAASRARTVEGVSGIMNVIMLPMFILSGVFFSASRFPDVLQPFIQMLPLTALNDALRAVYNDGRSIAEVPLELLNLAFWTVIPALVALRLFRWR